MKLIIDKNWIRSKDVYTLINDQKMKNEGNLICPSGKVVSLFLIEEEPLAGMHMFDKMFRDYKQTTENLKLLIAGKIKINDKFAPTYIIREKLSKKLFAHIFFEKEDKLYCFIFNLEKNERSLKALIASNAVFKEVIKLLEANL